uniref:Uncharacterized protein n=1 Tax=Kalanchoe fedtschenkoi TaxID=63787 RepID=A0A7N0UJP6_KALFE
MDSYAILLDVKTDAESGSKQKYLMLIGSIQLSAAGREERGSAAGMKDILIGSRFIGLDMAHAGDNRMCCLVAHPVLKILGLHVQDKSITAEIKKILDLS